MQMRNKFEIRIADKVIIPDIMIFPGGEVKVNIGEQPTYFQATILAHLFNSDDVMTLVMLVDALREVGVTKIRLTMPYLPYARQDRVCNAGESFSLRAFARIINSLKFASVGVFDVHSRVAHNHIDRLINIHQAEIMITNAAVVNWLAHDPSMTYIVAPDKGSVDKAKAVAKAFDCRGVIFAEKERDLTTGKIIRTFVKDLPSDVHDCRLLVVDDICDGGRTFVELGKVLPYCKDLSLYVTHGIFSQGKNALLSPGNDYDFPQLTGVYNNVWSAIDFKEYK